MICFVACFSSSIASNSYAQGPRLVKDINQTWGSHSGLGRSTFGTFDNVEVPRPDGVFTDFVTLNGVAYFAAYEPQHGTELWCSNGTESGTYLLKDIRSGPEDSFPIHLVAAGNAVYFFANDGLHGIELWTSDGTETGTRLVKDIAIGTSNGFQIGWKNGTTSGPLLAMIGGRVYFRASSGFGPELWVSDGTDMGTTGLGIRGLSPDHMTVFGDVLVFSALDADHGRELWRSDGTEGGTYRLKDIHPGVDASGRGIDSAPSQLTVAGSRLFFAADDGTHGREIWMTDGTSDGTVIVEDIHPGAGDGFLPDWDRTIHLPLLAAVGDVLYFRASHPDSGEELWRSNGTGATLVRDILEGTASSRPAYLVAVGGGLFFTARDAQAGRELFYSDGTETGTTLVEDILPGLQWSDPSELTAVGSSLYFIAFNSLDGRGRRSNRELWRSDGTAVGTFQVKDVHPGLWDEQGSISERSSDAVWLTALGDKLLFHAEDGVVGRELWLSDGTEAGTVLVKDINPGAFSDAFVYDRSETEGPNMAVWNGRLYFAPFAPELGAELWYSDGTKGGTELLKEINAPSPGVPIRGSAFRDPVVAGDYLFFAANSSGASTVADELWRTDGTAEGTIQLHSDLRPMELVESGGTLFLRRDLPGGAGRELWKSDGSAGGTMLVKDIWPGANPSLPNQLTDVAGTLYFVAITPDAGRELWRSDGTEEGTALVKDINPGLDPLGLPLGSAPLHLTAVGETLYFTADDDINGRQIWRSDGAEADTVPVWTEGAPFSVATTARLAEYDGMLVFTATDEGGIGLWKTDGTPGNTQLIRHVNTGPMTQSGGLLYFAGSDTTAGWELWRSDATTAGTYRVRDIWPGSSSTLAGSSSPHLLTDVAGTLFFVANDGAHGIELWKTHGTEGSTVLVKDFYPGPGTSFPARLVSEDGALFLVANDRDHGREVWALSTPGCEVSPPGPFVAHVEKLFSAAVIGTDPDGGVLTVSSPDLPPGSILTPASGPAPLTANFEWIPSASDVGTHEVTVTFTDLDGLQTSCLFEVVVLGGTDRDGDGLLDDWEINGIDVTVPPDGVIDLDLPALGADPLHKDIFVEIDYMELAGTEGHSHKPKADALHQVIQAFLDAPVDNPDGTTGIRLHIDVSDALPHVETLGWEAGGDYYFASPSSPVSPAPTAGTVYFDDLKAMYLDPARALAFHYCIFAHSLTGDTYGDATGISRGKGGNAHSDFIVSLGGKDPTDPGGTLFQQAGTFMHELGHDLGRQHGGDDGILYKPNYLSVMNYWFQTRGLLKDGQVLFDYSRFKLPDLVESGLNEELGLKNPDDSTPVAGTTGYGTRFGNCCQREITGLTGDINDPIDWNGSGDPNDTSANVVLHGEPLPPECSRGCAFPNPGSATLVSAEDWSNLKFTGADSPIGKLPGVPIVLPESVEAEELTKTEDAQVLTTFGVAIRGPGRVELEVCETETYQYTIENTGNTDDTYDLLAASTRGFADVSLFPLTLALAAGESRTLTVSVRVPADASTAAADLLVIEAVSTSVISLFDTVETTTAVVAPGDRDGDGVPDACDAHPDSDGAATVVIGDCDSAVENLLFEDGSTMADLIADCAEQAQDHGDFVSYVAHLTNAWNDAGLISGKEKGSIQDCAAGD